MVNDNTQDECTNARPQKEEEKLGETNAFQKYLNYEIPLGENGGISNLILRRMTCPARGLAQQVHKFCTLPILPILPEIEKEGSLNTPNWDTEYLLLNLTKSNYNTTKNNYKWEKSYTIWCI